MSTRTTPAGWRRYAGTATLAIYRKCCSCPPRPRNRGSYLNSLASRREVNYFMEYIGGIAGGTLGYIHGNVKGAIAGYNLGKKFSQKSNSMPPITPSKSNKRRSSIASSRSGGTIKKSRRGSAVSYTMSRRSSMLSNYTPSYAGSSRSVGSFRSLKTNASKIVKRNKKSVNIKKYKTKLPSRKFRKAVRESLTDKPKGNYKKIHFVRMSPPGDNAQATEDFGLFFEPVRYAEALQVLWNANTPVEIPIWTDILFAQIKNTKLRIKDSWVDMEFKNMSQRTYHMIIREHKPKSRTLLAGQNGYQDWKRGLLQMIADGKNPQSNTPETLDTIPELVPQYNEFWTNQKTHLTLQPGETYKFKIQGPNDYLLDFEKMFQRVVDGTVPSISNYKPFVRNLSVTYHLDMVLTSSGQAGHWNPGVVTFAGGIAVRYDEYFKLECPETIGLLTSTAGGPNPLVRINTNVIKVFSSAQSGTVQDVLEQNPIDPEIDGLA